MFSPHNGGDLLVVVVIFRKKIGKLTASEEKVRHFLCFSLPAVKVVKRITFWSFSMIDTFFSSKLQQQLTTIRCKFFCGYVSQHDCSFSFLLPPGTFFCFFGSLFLICCSRALSSVAFRAYLVTAMFDTWPVIGGSCCCCCSYSFCWSRSYRVNIVRHFRCSGFAESFCFLSLCVGITLTAINTLPLARSLTLAHQSSHFQIRLLRHIMEHH